MEADKRLYTFSQRRNTTNNDCMKYFDAYAKVIKSYIGRTPIHPRLVKFKILEMKLLDTDNLKPEEKYKA